MSGATNGKITSNSRVHFPDGGSVRDLPPEAERHATRKLDSPPPPEPGPREHVHFPDGGTVNDLPPESPHRKGRKLDSPPPPEPGPREHVHFPDGGTVTDLPPESPRQTGRKLESPPPPEPGPREHVHFPDGGSVNDSPPESPRHSTRKLDSPPPPERNSLSPKVLPKSPTKELDIANAMAKLPAFPLSSAAESHSGENDSDDVVHLSARKEDGGPTPLTTTTTTTTTAAGGGAKKRFSSSELRGNLTKTNKNRDPLYIYEIVNVLGVGSMGSVAKVRKRASAIGGSARKEIQQRVKRERQAQQCFTLPVVGPLFQFCFKGVLERKEDDDERDAFSDAGRELVSAMSHETSSTSGTQSEMIYAMKSIHLSRVTDEAFVQELKNEVQILKSLDHPHIVRAIETFEHRNQIFVIMELCSGGDLYSRDPYTEEQAARIVGSVLSAIAYMHSKGILHRDLKYENVLFATPDPKSEVKLIDFGLSKMFGNEALTDGVGTIYTMAPEVLKGSYTKQADLWSLGVMTAMLLSSQMPFFGRKRSHIVEQIMQGKYEFKGRRWKRVSKQAKEFVSDLLVVDPEERATAEDALKSTWLNRRFAATTRSAHDDEIENANSSIVRFADYSKLRKVALMVVAHKSTTTEIGILRKVFQKYDTMRTGQLGYDQFKSAISQAGYSDDEIQKIFEAVDLDGTGKVRYTEFLAATIEAHGAISEERLAEAFDRLDSDDSGYIDANNLREILGADFPQEEIDDILKEASKTGDGKISYAEFLALWEDQNEAKRGEVIKEIELILPNMESERSGVSGDEMDIVSRANFIEAKKISLSEREEKHVFFQENVTTIPSETIPEETPEN